MSPTDTVEELVARLRDRPNLVAAWDRLFAARDLPDIMAARGSFASALSYAFADMDAGATTLQAIAGERDRLRAMLEASPSVEGLRERVSNMIGECADIKVTYDSVGRRYTHVANTSELAGAILAMFQGAAQSQPSASSNGRTEAEPSAAGALHALRLSLPILDDDLGCYRSDTPPARYDARGFVCLDDLSCDHDRWVECEATLRAMAAIRAVLPAEEWAENTYATSQAAVAFFVAAPALPETPPPPQEALSGMDQTGDGG